MMKDLSYMIFLAKGCFSDFFVLLLSNLTAMVDLLIREL